MAQNTLIKLQDTTVAEFNLDTGYFQVYYPLHETSIQNACEKLQKRFFSQEEKDAE